MKRFPRRLAAGLAILIGAVAVAVGILPAIFLRERFQALPAADASVRNQAQLLAQRLFEQLGGI